MRLKRRINHTNRARILRDMVTIRLNEEVTPPTFSTDFKLQTLGVPETGRIFVEGYYRSTSQRFDAGTVGEPRPLNEQRLDQVDLGGRILFRVLVVDAATGRLLASANQIAPVDDGEDSDRHFLISVKSVDLGEVPWRVDLNDAPDHRPALLVNKRLPGAIDLVTHDPRTQALLLPAVVREVFTFIGWDCEGTAEEGSWQATWLEFAHRELGIPAPVEGDSAELRPWIDDFVEQFSRDHELVTRFVQRLQEES